MNQVAAQTKSPALEMHNVSVAAMKNPAAILAVKVNWTVNAGEFWVVGAPQHSGKSDFLMTLGGIISPASGEFFFLGQRMPIFDEPRMAHRLKLGLVFDGGQLLGGLTVAENVALPLQYHGRLSPSEVGTRVSEVLGVMDLMPWANSTPANIGRSWRQRAGLARALVLRPEVLLLDSPLTGLDVRHVSWWLGFLDELRRGHPIMGGKPMTLVASANDLRPWRRHAERVACLCEGRFVVLGEWKAVEESNEQAVRELLRE